MVNSSMLGATSKLITASLPAAPGPMLGGHGYLDPGFVQDPDRNGALQGALDDFVDNKLPNLLDPKSQYIDNKNKYAFAIADLTDPDHPAYAGYNDTDYVFVASLAKILPLYAAYQLRSDLVFLWNKLTGNGANPITIDQLANQARIRYESMGASSDSLKLPNIESLFMIDFRGKLDFSSIDRVMTTTDVELGRSYGDLDKFKKPKSQRTFTTHGRMVR